MVFDSASPHAYDDVHLMLSDLSYYTLTSRSPDVCENTRLRFVLRRWSDYQVKNGNQELHLVGAYFFRQLIVDLNEIILQIDKLVLLSTNIRLIKKIEVCVQAQHGDEFCPSEEKLPWASPQFSSHPLHDCDNNTQKTNQLLKTDALVNNYEDTKLFRSNFTEFLCSNLHLVVRRREFLLKFTLPPEYRWEEHTWVIFSDENTQIKWK